MPTYWITPGVTERLPPQGSRRPGTHMFPGAPGEEASRAGGGEGAITHRGGPHGLAERTARSPSPHSLQEPRGSSEAEGLPS